MLWWWVAAIWLLFVLTVVFQPVYRVGDWWLDRRAARRQPADALPLCPACVQGLMAGHNCGRTP